MLQEALNKTVSLPLGNEAAVCSICNSLEKGQTHPSQALGVGEEVDKLFAGSLSASNINSAINFLGDLKQVRHIKSVI